MTNCTQVLVEELNKYLSEAPETFFTKQNGREVTEDTLTAFLYLHCLEDEAFDNYTLIQAANLDWLVTSLMKPSLAFRACGGTLAMAKTSTK